MALEDAIALARACATTDDVGAALGHFERARRPGVEKLLGVAARSFRWYEQMRQALRLTPVAFAYDYMMRGGALSHERLRERSPGFVAVYEGDQART